MGMNQSDTADFIVLRNSEQVGISTGLAFEDEPLIAGATSYTITPVIEGQTLLEGSMTVTDFEVSLSIESNNQVSETGGFVLGLIFILSSFAVISDLLERRNKQRIPMILVQSRFLFPH